MNLGIEDGWEFANLAASGDLAQDSARRHPVGHGVVRQTDMMTRVMSAHHSGLSIL